MTPMEELREQAAKIAPCPFCGENLRHSSHKGVEFWMHPGVVTDDDCVLSGKGFYPKELAAWKRRALPAPVALPKAGEVEQLRHKVWMVICHASGGRLAKPQDVDRSINDICVQITQKVNDAYEAGKAAPTPTEAPTAAEELAGEGGLPCDRCQGNGEIITDWDRYMNGQPGDVGDEGTADCPDCNGTGRIDETAAAPDDGLMGRYREALIEIERYDGAFTSKCRDIARTALSTATGDEAQQGEG